MPLKGSFPERGEPGICPALFVSYAFKNLKLPMNWDRVRPSKDKGVFTDRIMIWMRICKGVKGLIFGLAGVLFMTSSAWAGVILQKQSYRVVEGGKGSQVLEVWKEYYQDGKIAVYQGNAVFIINIQKEELINIIPSRQIYAVNTVSDFIRRIERIVREVQTQPMFREQSDKSCKSVKISIRRTGKTQKILGYQARRYDIFVNGVKKREVWISQVPPLLKEVDFDKTMALKFRIENILTPLSDCKDIESNPGYRRLFVKGKIPVMVIDFLPGREEIERVTKIKMGPIPPRLFEPPKGFKKVPIEAFMQH